jgi:hypothetical protein
MYACIEPYEAEVEEESRVLVVEGSIVKGDSIQTILVSTTSPLVDPRPRPVPGCAVEVEDDQGHVFYFSETEAGTYTRVIPDDQLIIDRKYMARIITPEGKLIESAFETLNAAAEVDSVYFALEPMLNSITGEEVNGAQYYIDIKATDEVPRYFRWILEETYEYTSTGEISYYLWDTDFKPDSMIDHWALYRCWMINQRVEGLYLSNTVNLTFNEKRRIPLHYISVETDRMKIRYNLLVKQYSMNEASYNYWQQNKTATEEGGGLYTSQPSQPLTNLCNVNDTTDMVVGFFWVSSKTEKRLVVPRPNALFVPDEKCIIILFDPLAWANGPWPVYIRIDEDTGDALTGDHYCFDCQLRGGSLIPPDFWE